MESCDVLIIGGGPAGSTFARKMRGSGMDIMVLDKNEFPRDKVCAGWVTPAVLKTLRIDTEEYRFRRVLQPITGFRTSLMSGAGVETRYEGIVSFGIRRSEFDHYLLERSGARLRLGEPLKTLRREKGLWIVNDQIKTPLVIGAGGNFCPVALYLDHQAKESKNIDDVHPSTSSGQTVNPFMLKSSRHENLVVAQEMEFEMDERQQGDCRIRPDTPELYFCDDLKGYGWCFRKGNFLNIGLGRNDKNGLSEHVRAFYCLLKEKGRVHKDTPAEFKGHAYLLYRQGSRNIVGEGVMLIGDAAGLAYPQSGEGIRPAVESALMAADVVISALGNYRRERLQRYPEMLTARFGKGSGSIFDMFPQGLKSMAGRGLMSSRWFTRNILLDRWFLHSHQPQLN